MDNRSRSHADSRRPRTRAGTKARTTGPTAPTPLVAKVGTGRLQTSCKRSGRSGSPRRARAALATDENRVSGSAVENRVSGSASQRLSTAAWLPNGKFQRPRSGLTRVLVRNVSESQAWRCGTPGLRGRISNPRAEHVAAWCRSPTQTSAAAGGLLGKAEVRVGAPRTLARPARHRPRANARRESTLPEPIALDRAPAQ